MSNEEWWGKIEKTYTHENAKWILGDALRAVVELHTPWELQNGVGIRCSFCANYDYPCPTIQAIEKELQ